MDGVRSPLNPSKFKPGPHEHGGMMDFGYRKGIRYLKFSNQYVLVSGDSIMPGLSIILLILVLILGLDVSLILYWERYFENLGKIFGFELGLVIFLNFLGLMLILDILQNLVQFPGFGWFYRLAPARNDGFISQLFVSSGDRTESISIHWIRVLRRIFILAVIFFMLENLVFPFIPFSINHQFEAILIGTGVLWQLVPSWLRW